MSTEEYQIALTDAERNRQETLKFQMANNRNKAKVKELGNLFKVSRIELEEKEDQMTEVLKENARLRDNIKEMEEAPVPIPLPECKECDRLLEKCVYLEGQLYRKDMVIDSFAHGWDREK